MQLLVRDQRKASARSKRIWLTEDRERALTRVPVTPSQGPSSRMRRRSAWYCCMIVLVPPILACHAGLGSTPSNPIQRRSSRTHRPACPPSGRKRPVVRTGCAAAVFSGHSLTRPAKGNRTRPRQGQPKGIAPTMIVDIVSLQHSTRPHLGHVAQRFVGAHIGWISYAAHRIAAWSGLGYPAVSCAPAHRALRAGEPVHARAPGCMLGRTRRIAPVSSTVGAARVDGAYERALWRICSRNVGDPDEFLHGNLAHPRSRRTFAIIDPTGVASGACRRHPLRPGAPLFGSTSWPACCIATVSMRRSGTSPSSAADLLAGFRAVRVCGSGRGCGLRAPFAGVHIVEATRQDQRPIPVRQRSRRLRLSPRLSPASSPAGAPVPQRSGDACHGNATGSDPILRMRWRA